MFNWIVSDTLNPLAEWKRMNLKSFKNVFKMCLQIMYLVYMYTKDSALNNLQGFICHKTKLSKIIYI